VCHDGALCLWENNKSVPYTHICVPRRLPLVAASGEARYFRGRGEQA